MYMEIKFNKNEILEKIIKTLDITPTMYKNAEDKYKSLAKYLEDKGLKCDIYPQGSFSLGTVIKPLKEGKIKEYDLDFICVIYDEENLSPKDFRKKIWDIIRENKTYSKIITEYDKCFTLEYSKINEIGFNIDILPAKPSKDNFIFLTNKINKEDIKWFESNPKDYSNWFKEVNDKYPQAKTINEMYAMIAKESVENLPNLFDRTSLQRVIQFLKYNRDHFYYTIRKENKKVISAIITTICTKIAEKIDYTSLNIIDLLRYIVSDLCIYAQLIFEENLDQRYEDKIVIKKTNCKWEILNPVNPNDNLADSWNEDSEKPRLFFKWIENIKKEILIENEREYLTNFSNIFGMENLDESIKTFLGTPKEVDSMKPWRK